MRVCVSWSRPLSLVPIDQEVCQEEEEEDKEEERTLLYFHSQTQTF